MLISTATEGMFHRALGEALVEVDWNYFVRVLMHSRIHGGHVPGGKRLPRVDPSPATKTSSTGAACPVALLVSEVSYQCVLFFPVCESNVL